MKRIVLGVIVTLWSTAVFAQDNDYRDHDAVIIDATQSIYNWSASTISVKGNVPGVRIIYLKSMKNNQADWVDIFGKIRVSHVGLEASYWNLRNVVYKNGVKHAFGDNYAMLASVEIPLFNIWSTTVAGSLGAGFDYTTKDFYNTENTNYAFGSHINFQSKIEVKWICPLPSNFYFVGSADIQHLSNSDMKQPNAAFNRVAFSGGLMKTFSNEPAYNTQHLFGDYKDNLFSAHVVYGWQGSAVTGYYKTPYGGKYPDTIPVQTKSFKLPQIGVSLNYEHRFGPVFAATAGIDAIGSIIKYNVHNFFPTYESNYGAYNRITGGVTIGGEVWLGDFVCGASYEQYLFGNFIYAHHPGGLIFSGRYNLTRTLAIEGKAYSRRFGGAGIAITF